jgi:predicted ATPase/DNA-binding winged helix-turn-helix (wHTH) protein
MKHFAPFSFDPAEGRLFRGCEELPLTRKASALLDCLLSGGGSWVSKETIMSAVWPDTHVQPDNIKVLVREIRQSLGDDPKSPSFIRSRPGRGYAFVAPVSERAEVRGGDTLAGARMPIFVNRGPELAALADALDAARASARRLVLVSGEHGIGKSALCDAFLRTAQAGGPVRTCYGQCIDRESPQEPYYPFLDALLRLDRQHRGIVPDLLSQLAPSWLAHFPQWLGARISSTVPRGMLEELSDVLDALSHDMPLVIVLEDLQWADADTVRALTHLAASSTPSKLLIVATSWNGEWAAGSRAKLRLTSAFGSNPRRLTIELGPLTVAHVNRYVDARFGPGCVSELASSVHRATSGNPYMVVNAFDSLVARGLVAEGADGWRREAPLQRIAEALPETLSESIAQQLDQLDARERETLEAAAAIGTEFTSSTVAFALEAKVEAVRSVLGPLARRGQLIVPAIEPGSPRTVQDAYRFRHALHADVIAQRAPMLRQLRITERVNHVRMAGEAPLRRA